MIWKILQVIILAINAVAILNEERFLRRIGLGHQPEILTQESFKARIVNLLHAVRVLMRLPLIFLNAGMIVGSFLLG